jgi:hypothetical protein
MTVHFPGTSIKSDEVKIVLCAQTSLPSDASAFHFGVKYQLTYHINLVNSIII